MISNGQRHPSKPDFANEPSRVDVMRWIWDNIFVCPSGCWLWLGADSGQDENARGAGYPKMRFLGKTRYVHRVIYTFLIGPIPKGYQIDHKCKHWSKVFPFAHRRCINPDHLEAVTQSDNIKRNSLGSQIEMFRKKEKENAQHNEPSGG